MRSRRFLQRVRSLGLLIAQAQGLSGRASGLSRGGKRRLKGLKHRVRLRAAYWWAELRLSEGAGSRICVVGRVGGREGGARRGSVRLRGAGVVGGGTR